MISGCSFGGYRIDNCSSATTSSFSIESRGDGSRTCLLAVCTPDLRETRSHLVLYGHMTEQRLFPLLSQVAEAVLMEAAGP